MVPLAQPRMLIAREATMASVASEMQLSSIISSFARAESGATSSPNKGGVNRIG